MNVLEWIALATFIVLPIWIIVLTVLDAKSKPSGRTGNDGRHMIVPWEENGEI